MEEKPEDLDFDYRSQLFAIRSLLSRQDQADRELEDRIEHARKMAVQTSGDANESWVQESVDHMHNSLYQDVAHSMAAVSMIAPLFESVFKRVFRHMEKEWSGPRGIMKYVDEVGMEDYMPHDLGITLEALFEYRNKMFHCGFEWPLEERQGFEGKRCKSCWPSDWFDKARTDNEPWMFYMTPKFVDHCVDSAEQVCKALKSLS